MSILRPRCLSVLAVLTALAAAAPSHAQGQPVRLDLRIVPQTGAIPGPITDLPGNVHDPVLMPGQTRRFEVQYRIVDLIPDDEIIPRGLSVCGFDLEVVLRGAQGTLGRAPISRYEVQQAGPVPPVSPDSSGAPTSPFIGTTGMHKPFRQFPAPPPNNNSRRNGEPGIDTDPNPTINNGVPGPGNTALRNINCEVFGGAGQEEPDAWYGLYTFEFTASGGGNSADAPGLRTTFRMTVLLTEPQQGYHYAYATDLSWLTGSSHWSTGIAEVFIAPPGQVGACCCGSTCSVTTAAACAGIRTAFAGVGTACNAPGDNAVPCCRANYNQSTGGEAVTVQDIFDFLEGYFNTDACADMDGSGGVPSVQDLFDFLEAHFEGFALAHGLEQIPIAHHPEGASTARGRYPTPISVSRYRGRAGPSLDLPPVLAHGDAEVPRAAAVGRAGGS